MKKDQLKNSIKQVKNGGVEISVKFLRAKRWEEKKRIKKMTTWIKIGGSEFKDAILRDNGLEDDTLYSENFRRAYRND